MNTDRITNLDFAPVLWREGRRHLLKALNDGRPLTFCIQVYQQVISAYQRRRGIAVIVLADFQRQSMIDHLESLE